MKNTIKMSLAAAVAVSAFSTSAFAGNLEEMIKGVEVSGYVDYRLENSSGENKLSNTNTNSSNNEYAVNVTVNSKVNDIVTATVSAGFDEVRTSNNSTTAADADPSMNVSNAYFTFAMGNTTVMAGKQAIPSVFVDQVDTAKTGAGIVAVHKISDAITLAGAHFMNNNIGAIMNTGAGAAFDTKTTELIAMGKVAMVNYAINYNMTDVANVLGGVETDRYSINVGATVGPVKIDVRHTNASVDDSDDKTAKWDDAEVTKVSVSGKVGSVKLGALYAMTGKQNFGRTGADVAIDGDNDAQVHAKVWQLSTDGLNDGDVYVISASMPIMDKVTAAVAYGAAEGIAYNAAGVKGDVESDELLFKLTYKMSKNFTIHGRYSMLDSETKIAGAKTADRTNDLSRIQVKYTF